MIGRTNTTDMATASSQLQISSATGSTKLYIIGTPTTGTREELYAAMADANNTNNPTGIYFDATNGVLMGAAWNDYAECRKGPKIKAGMCVIENGDDTLKLSDCYAAGSAYIVSDTYGMAIGQTDDCELPIAIAGRVLAYPEEGRDLYINEIGSPVCSGPNGKIILMDDGFAASHPWTIIGTVSSVPTYEKWNGVEVDGRVWIKVR